MSTNCPPTACADCLPTKRARLEQLGLKTIGWDYIIALAGNPNTGKSTVFNALTGLRQHTGNWPGKTISRAEGGFSLREARYKLVDLPGTYSLLSTSADEEVARNFLLFGQPDVTVIVIDATSLERNLNLTLQILQITDKAVIALNLIDEAEAHGINVDCKALTRQLGAPVIPMAARSGQGIEDLLNAIEAVASETLKYEPLQIPLASDEPMALLQSLTAELQTTFPELKQCQWVAWRLLENDSRIKEAVATGAIQGLGTETSNTTIEGRAIVERSSELRWQLPPDFHDSTVESIAAASTEIASACVQTDGPSTRLRWQRLLDRWLTHPITAFPLMGLIMMAVLWITIEGANVPSSMLASLFLEQLHPFLKELSAQIRLPFWLDGLLLDGIFLTTGWVISVMLPPMAIFFPLFTLLEDFGYLPRVAFNLDRLFQKSGAHGKQALTMAMGYGCNAAGVIATRVIDSPRERLIAILTNNFALCNGRWPTQILIASIFIGSLAPKPLAGLIAAAGVFTVASLGIFLTFLVSFGLSRTLLKGTASAFSLEMPPYRPPAIWRTLYTSLIDRTLFVLWRAVVFAVPAGIVIWGICNINIGEISLALWAINGLDPLAAIFGLTGVVVLAYIVAIPANEIVIPTILMLTVMVTGMAVEGASGAGVMFENDDVLALSQLLTAGGWTTLTAICLMLFSLCHNPCSTTLFTIYKETGSLRWTTWAAVIPTAIGLILCALVSSSWHLFS
ncbi:MAG: Fe(2+) transporter FeoB [Opitutia bacterium UBA7350]|nr:MAG: Fe(2+) transporter FeoB [Opitutae bacterium UBA7350]